MSRVHEIKTGKKKKHSIDGDPKIYNQKARANK